MEYTLKSMGSAFTLADNLKEIIGTEELFDMLLRAMGLDDADAYLSFICRQLDIDFDEDGEIVDGE